MKPQINKTPNKNESGKTDKWKIIDWNEFEQYVKTCQQKKTIKWKG